MLPWIICGALAVAVLCLTVKIILMRKSLREITDAMQEHLSLDTNRLVSVSSRDRYVRQLASEIARQLAVLRRQRRLYESGDRELKEAVTNVSHDLRTPLTAICGYLDLLQKEEQSEQVALYLSRIRDRAEALKVLMEELFHYSVLLSVREDRREQVDLSKALEESLAARYGEFTAAGITPKISLTQKPVVRELDPLALERIFGNILGNALKYSSGGLSVVLTEEGSILFSNPAPHLDQVSVGKLFDRFFTVENARSSTGLGLSIAKLLTSRMGGRIAAELKDGILTIRLLFP